MDFVPDVEIRHGDVIKGDGWTVECVFTPGHTSNHICFALKEEKALFTGDHVMGWSTSIVSPPDGNMRAYMASLRLLLERDDEIYRSEEHTSELQSLMRISYAVFCLKKKKKYNKTTTSQVHTHHQI